jgi:hypothetical protein
LIVAGIGFLFARRRKQQKASQAYTNTAEVSQYQNGYQQQGGYAAPVVPGSSKYHMESDRPHELGAEVPPQELPATR